MANIAHNIAARAIAIRMRQNKKRPLILALDVATRTGWAIGRLGETPTSGSIRFGNQSGNSDVIFGCALGWAHHFLQERRPDIVMFESLLPPDAMKGKTSRQVRDRLAGLHGIIRACCYQSSVALDGIAECAVGDVRRHFVGDGKLKRDAAKREVMRRCAQLGWEARDDNAGDALAIWSYACAIIDPTTAIRTSPLFNKAVAI